MITLKAVLWDLDDTLYSRRDEVRQLFPGLLRACLYTDRSDEFIREAVEFLMTQIKGNRMICETAFRALLERYPGDRPYIHEACVAYYYANIRSFAVPLHLH